MNKDKIELEEAINQCNTFIQGFKERKYKCCMGI